MTEQGTDQRLAALKRRRQPSPTPPTTGTGTKWTVAGGAVGATLAMIGAMTAAGRASTGAETIAADPVATPAPVIVVINQPPAAASGADAITGEGPAGAVVDEAIIAEALDQMANQTIAEVPPAPAQVNAQPAAQTESGGS